MSEDSHEQILHSAEHRPGTVGHGEGDGGEGGTDDPVGTPPVPPAIRGKGRRVTVETGIYRDRFGYGVITSGRRDPGDSTATRFERRFPPNTPIEVMRVWRQDKRNEAEREYVAAHRQELFPRGPDGWCYVYFISDGRQRMKIGRAVDPMRRLAELQVSHGQRLTLTVAVPAHAVVETAIHKRFEHLRLSGEWFAIDDELRVFVGALLSGKSPIALLWSEVPLGLPGWRRYLRPLRKCRS